jgi:hypothetical protein
MAVRVFVVVLFPMQPVSGDVGLGHIQAAMAQELLDGLHGHAAFLHMGGDRVAQAVQGDHIG